MASASIGPRRATSIASWLIAAALLQVAQSGHGLAGSPPRQAASTSAVGPAQSAIAGGRYAEARALLEPVARTEPNGDAALELGLLDLMLGRRREGEATLRTVLNGNASGRSAAGLVRAARAARALGRPREANAFFQDAASLAPDDPGVHTAWGDLFLETHDPREAARSYRLALKADDRWAPAHLGLAQALAGDNPPAARVAAERALALDRTLIPAHLLLAELALDDGRRDEGRRRLERVFELSPSSLDGHALAAAVAYLEGRTEEFDRHVGAALAINPRYGDAYRVAGDHAARNYRFEEAVALVRRALEIDPTSVRARADLGLHLVRTGDEEEARQVLTEAFQGDSYDQVTHNLLGLFDVLEAFETIKEEGLIVRLHGEEAGVLREYALPWARDALKTLSARYGVVPRGPVLLEVFPRHDDFAVRNVGLPGMEGALGACFGRVVTMDSPRARAPGTFHWGATLWHEMAHVVTLQLSRQRIPRWLTEGISVYEEKRARPEWGRDAEIGFVQALDRGSLLPIADLNAGFQRPDRIGLAYYQASLVVEHIVDAHGEGALARLVASYGDGIETPAAVKAALGVDVDDLQKAFDAFLGRRFGSLRAALRVPEGLANATTVESLRAIVDANPASYPALITLGERLHAAGDRDGARQAFERAVRLVPAAVGPESARSRLVDVLIAANDRPRAIAELVELLKHDHTSVDVAHKLADLARSGGDAAALRHALERLVELDPFDPASHTALGRLALERKAVDTALREFRAALAAGPVDRADAHCDLAAAYLAAGKRQDAKEQAIAALEIAPSYDRAQELLLKAVEGRQ